MTLKSEKTQTKCLLCKSTNYEFFFKDKFRAYRRCSVCSIIFVPKEFHVTIESEKARYEEHNNDADDIRYREFLERIAVPIRERFSVGLSGVDFGCGPTTLLADILSEDGFEMAVYDPFYADDKSVLDKKYDFIVSTEVVEHLNNPLLEFKKLFSMLKSDGVLAIMTRPFDDSIDFKTWHYKNDRTHIGFYSIATFDWLADNLGVSYEQVENDIFVFTGNAEKNMKIQELAYHKTDLGELMLRRREEPRLQNREVFEVKLGEEFLMSSLFTKAEEELANIGLAGLNGELDVVVGGLGLGYTAVAALENENLESLLVIDIFQEVIDWHQNKLVPMGEVLSDDDRCELRQGDFFGLARTGFDISNKERKFDAVLLDIDHSPDHFLDASNESFYGAKGLRSLKNQLKRGGVFALWSDDPKDDKFTKHLESIFGEAISHDIEFPNPYTNAVSLNSVYKAISK